MESAALRMSLPPARIKLPHFSHRPLLRPSKLASASPASTTVLFSSGATDGRRRLRQRALGSGLPVDEGPESPVPELRVPDSWLQPSKALQESEWLRVALHKWLDDEYCPEPSNVEISKVAARSYYESLVSKEADVGMILLKMVRDLETISFQESFHGPFSSANAAIHLVTLRMNSMEA